MSKVQVEEKVDQIDLDQMVVEHARHLKGLKNGARLFLNFKNCTGLYFNRMKDRKSVV